MKFEVKTPLEVWIAATVMATLVPSAANADDFQQRRQEMLRNFQERKAGFEQKFQQRQAAFHGKVAGTGSPTQTGSFSLRQKAGFDAAHAPKPDLCFLKFIDTTRTAS